MKRAPASLSPTGSRSLFIVGAGRVGMSMGLAASGWHVLGAYCRTESSAQRASSLLGAPGYTSLDAAPLDRADVVLMPVADDHVVTTAARLAPLLEASQVLLHTSGSLASTVMASPDMKAHLGSCHPLQALASVAGDPDKLAGAYFAVEGDDLARQVSRDLALACGGHPVDLLPEGKVLYHASAVVAANFLTVLVDAAVFLAREAGVADTATAVNMLLPLLQGTVDNLRSIGTEGGREALGRSMTGPVRRGDVGTLEAHLLALDGLAEGRRDLGDLPALYRLLASRAAELAFEAGLEPESAAKMAALLQSKTRGDEK